MYHFGLTDGLFSSYKVDIVKLMCGQCLLQKTTYMTAVAIFLRLPNRNNILFVICKISAL